VLTLMLILLVVGVSLAVVIYIGSMFLQGYIYTEPSDQLYWQAPAAAGVLMVYFMLWCVLIANSKDATPTNIPYDVIQRASAEVDLLPDPAKEIWVEKKNDEKKVYQRRPNPTGGRGYRYVDPLNNRVLSDEGVQTVELVIDGEKHVFQRTPTSPGDNISYVSDNGWVMKGYGDGPSGIPTLFRWGRFWLTVFLNLLHFVAWWLCLWLLVRFQMLHALGLAFALWLVVTLSVLPMLLGYAAEVAQRTAT
jgi:hypothetical protein